MLWIGLTRGWLIGHDMLLEGTGYEFLRPESQVTISGKAIDKTMTNSSGIKKSPTGIAGSVFVGPQHACGILFEFVENEAK